MLLLLLARVPMQRQRRQRSRQHRRHLAHLTRRLALHAPITRGLNLGGGDQREQWQRWH